VVERISATRNKDPASVSGNPFLVEYNLTANVSSARMQELWIDALTRFPDRLQGGADPLNPLNDVKSINVTRAVPLYDGEPLPEEGRPESESESTPTSTPTEDSQNASVPLPTLTIEAGQLAQLDGLLCGCSLQFTTDMAFSPQLGIRNATEHAANLTLAYFRNVSHALGVRPSRVVIQRAKAKLRVLDGLAREAMPLAGMEFGTAVVFDNCTRANAWLGALEGNTSWPLLELGAWALPSLETVQFRDVALIQPGDEANASECASQPGAGGCVADVGHAYSGDLANSGSLNPQPSPEECCRSCQVIPSCVSWTWLPEGPQCWLASSVQPQRRADAAAVSGYIAARAPSPVPAPAPTGSVATAEPPSDSPTAAAPTARPAAPFGDLPDGGPDGNTWGPPSTPTPEPLQIDPAEPIEDPYTVSASASPVSASPQPTTTSAAWATEGAVPIQCSDFYAVSWSLQVLPHPQSADSEDSTSPGMSWPAELESHWCHQLLPLVRLVATARMGVPQDSELLQHSAGADVSYRIVRRRRSGSCPKLGLEKVAEFRSLFLSAAEAEGFLSWLAEQGGRNLASPLLSLDPMLCRAEVRVSRSVQKLAALCLAPELASVPADGKATFPDASHGEDRC